MVEPITYVYKHFWKNVPIAIISEEIDASKQNENFASLTLLEEICRSLSGTSLEGNTTNWTEREDSFLICSKDGSASHVYIRIRLVQGSNWQYYTSVTYPDGFENEALLSKLFEFYKDGLTSKQIFPNIYKSKVKKKRLI